MVDCTRQAGASIAARNAAIDEIICKEVTTDMIAAGVGYLQENDSLLHEGKVNSADLVAQIFATMRVAQQFR